MIDDSCSRLGKIKEYISNYVKEDQEEFDLGELNMNCLS